MFKDLRVAITKAKMWKELSIKFATACALGVFAGFASRVLTDSIYLQVILGTIIPMTMITAIIVYFYKGR